MFYISFNELITMYFSFVLQAHHLLQEEDPF